ncbi:MAG: hypothetical protein AAGI38_24465 [Bacteroidota bacterium]
MRKIHLALVTTLAVLVSCQTNSSKPSFASQQVIVSADIANFWQAYDAIQITEDSIQQLAHLHDLFLSKASVGQQRMMEARRYTPEEYLRTITSYPAFWNSIRSNTEDLEPFNEALRSGVNKLASIYPDITHSTIYYTVGTHRAPGTGFDGTVLIGTEYALGDSTTVTFELPEHKQNYYKINPTKYLTFLCVHEYVHTQQLPMVYDLLSLTLYEGIAEFVAIKATGQNSPWKAFTYGPEHEDRIRQRFEKDMFRPNTIYNWLWNSPQNEFNTSDLGYFVGHQLAARYYDAAGDKKEAIKQLIDLDYEQKSNVEGLVNSTRYFSKPLGELYQDYESKQPTVIGIKQFKNHSQEVSPSIDKITIEFSQPLNGHHTGVDFGELGEDAFPKGTLTGRHWGADNQTWTIPVELEPNKRYQILISYNFRTDDNVHLKPYLIDFMTK